MGLGGLWDDLFEVTTHIVSQFKLLAGARAQIEHIFLHSFFLFLPPPSALSCGRGVEAATPEQLRTFSVSSQEY